MSKLNVLKSQIWRAKLFLGDILAIFLYLLSIHWDVWSKISQESQLALTLALIWIFIFPHTLTYSKREAPKTEEPKKDEQNKN